MISLENMIPKNKKHAILLVIFVLSLIATLAYLLFKTEEAEKKDYRATKVEVEEVRIGSMTRTVTEVGTLRASKTVIIRPEISGLVSKVHVEGGEYVNEDDLIFSLDDRVAQAELKEAEAKLAHAKATHDRASRLEAKKFGSTANKDKTLAELNIAEASLESARSRLERTVIKAPFDGIVGLHNISVGAPVDPNKELITLVDITPMKVEFKVPAKFLRYISIGQRVKVAVDGFREKKFPGLIEGIDAKVDSSSHSIEARALIPNKGRILKPGLFARVDVVVGSKSKALILPATAVDKQGDQEFVFKVVEGRAFQTPVITGIQEGENIEILRGVNPGDHIVTVGQLKIQDGSPVRYEFDGKLYAHDQEAEDKKIAKIKAEKEAAAKAKEKEEEDKAKKKEEADKPKSEEPADKVKAQEKADKAKTEKEAKAKDSKKDKSTVSPAQSPKEGKKATSSKDAKTSDVKEDKADLKSKSGDKESSPKTDKNTDAGSNTPENKKDS